MCFIMAATQEWLSLEIPWLFPDLSLTDRQFSLLQLIKIVFNVFKRNWFSRVRIFAKMLHIYEEDLSSSQGMRKIDMQLYTESCLLKRIAALKPDTGVPQIFCSWNLNFPWKTRTIGCLFKGIMPLIINVYITFLSEENNIESSKS